jgi:hypothetical protein
LSTVASQLSERAKRWRIPRERAVQVLIGGLVLAIIGPIVTDLYYNGDLLWPVVVATFTGAVLAFLVALAWDRHQDIAQEARTMAAEARAQENELRKEQERRVLEAKRRFSAIALELERLQASINRTMAEQHQYKNFFPDLPTGSFRAASVPLGMIVSNYGLMADLATFYGHVEELQWRLRFKADPQVDEEGVSPLIAGLAGQMGAAVEDLIKEVRRQAANPDIESVMSESGGTVVSRRQMTGAIRVIDPGAGATPIAGLGGQPPAGG